MSLRIRVQRNEFYYQVGFGRVETAAAAAAAAGVAAGVVAAAGFAVGNCHTGHSQLFHPVHPRHPVGTWNSVVVYRMT